MNNVNANELRTRWLTWAATNRDDRGDYDEWDARYQERRHLVWPPRGTQRVRPYVVEVTELASNEMTSFKFLLFVKAWRGFRCDGDHLLAMTSAEAPGRMTINDLLVKPGKRNRGRGSALLAGLESFGEGQMIRWVDAGISQVDDMPRVESFYRRRGYRVVKGIPSGPFIWTALKELSP